MIDVNETNSSVELDGILVGLLGDRRPGIGLALTFTVIYVLIFLTGLFGNVCTCLVVLRNPYMHTATNYYLFSLAVSDVLAIIVCLPAEVYSIWESYPWRLGEEFCIFRVFTLEFTAVASCLTITAFTIERYVAICHPIRAKIWSGFRHVVVVIVSVWVIAAFCAFPYAFNTRSFYAVTMAGKPVSESMVCNIPRDVWASTMVYVLPVSTFVLFVGPMTVITVLYVLIGVALNKSIRQMARQQSTDTNKSGVSTQHSRKSVVKMLIAVVVAFFICWAPFHIQRLMSTLVSKQTPLTLAIQNVLFYVAGILYFLSSTINPLLYNVMSKRYRKAFLEMFTKCGSQGGFGRYQRSINTSFKTRSSKNTLITGYTDSPIPTNGNFRANCPCDDQSSFQRSNKSSGGGSDVINIEMMKTNTGEIEKLLEKP